MSFTDQKPRVATEEDCTARWSFGKPGQNFRCSLCGYRFKVGDIWRWQYSYGKTITIDGRKRGLTNFMVCEKCDGPDALDRWAAANEEALTRFWWLFED